MPKRALKPTGTTSMPSEAEALREVVAEALREAKVAAKALDEAAAALGEVFEAARRLEAQEGQDSTVPPAAAVKRRPASSADRVRRHREAARHKGMRSITLWVPDTRSPEFLEAARAACLRANEADKTDPAVKAFDAIVEETLRDFDDEGGL